MLRSSQMDISTSRKGLTSAVRKAIASPGTVVSIGDGKSLVVVIVNTRQPGDPSSNGSNWSKEHYTGEMLKQMKPEEQPAFWGSIGAMFDKSNNSGVYLIEIQPDGSKRVVGEAEWNTPHAYVARIESAKISSTHAEELHRANQAAVALYKEREGFTHDRAGHCAGLATAEDYRGLGVGTALRLLSLIEMKKAGCTEAFAECTGDGSFTVFTRGVAKKHRVDILKRIPYSFGSQDTQFTVLTVQL